MNIKSVLVFAGVLLVGYWLGNKYPGWLSSVASA